MTDSIPAERGAVNRLAFKCDMGEARVATRILRAFLAEQGLDESEQFHCELCLAEACNNAVQYATPAGAQLPVIAEVICHPTRIELRVTDRTAGFELPPAAATIDPHRENGRGLFIIQSLMDAVNYYHGSDENTLVMHKKRTHQQHRPAEDAANATLEEARRQLENCQQTISGMARELCFRSESLSAIFRCCAELGRTSDLEGFGNRLMSDLMHLTGADWFVLRLLPANDSRLVTFAVSRPELRGEPIAVVRSTELLPAELAAAITRREVELDCRHNAVPEEPLRAAGPNATGLVQPLLFGDKLLGTLAIGKVERIDPKSLTVAGDVSRPAADSRLPLQSGLGRSTPSAPPFTALQAEMIRAFAEFMAVQIVNMRHLEEQMQLRLVAHELEIAHRIQRALLPRSLPQLAGFRLAGNWESARQVGGDFYDAFPLDDHSLLLVVADVMGKGVPAAIFATITRSLLRAMAARSHHPAKLLKRLNELLYAELSSVGMFITAQLVFIDLRRRQLVAASAGHCPVLVLSGETVRALNVTGTPLGILPDASYRQTTATLAQPAGLLLYTDGLTEAQNDAGEMFGHDRLAEWVRARAPLPATAEELRDELAAELSRFRGAAPLRDDQAFLILAEDPDRIADFGLRIADSQSPETQAPPEVAAVSHSALRTPPSALRFPQSA